MCGEEPGTRLVTVTCGVCSLLSVPVVMGFEEASYTARESDGSVELCVNLTDPAVIRREVTLNVQTLPGTASKLWCIPPWLIICFLLE